MSDNFSGKLTVENIARELVLENLTPDIDISKREISSYSICRPALPLAGFFDGFKEEQHDRIQLIGHTEQKYIQTLTDDEKHERFARIASINAPCIIFTRGFVPCKHIINSCKENNVPVLLTERPSSETVAEITRRLRVALAPKKSIHGVLVDVYGEGVLIIGDSGIGKSEAALELIKRGHRLVADDVVEIRKVSDTTLVGMAPEITKDFIELRGIGIINVRSMFGYEAVKQTQSIDMVINLEVFDKEKEYDRLGMERESEEILGNKLVKYSIPIRPGRNIAIIVECAAINNRAIKMGYDAPNEFMKRVNSNILSQSMAFSPKDI